MPYSTKDEIRAASGFTNTTNISDATIDAYIADADSVINSKISDIYSLPLASTPDIINMLSRYLTIGLLYSNEYGEESQDTDKGWEKKMKWAMDILEDIRKQKTRLVDSSGDELARKTLRSVSFYPTAASSDPAAEDSTEPRIKMTTKF